MRMREVKHRLAGIATICCFVALLGFSSAFAQSIKVNLTHTSVNVTTGTTEIVDAASRRGYLLFENDSDEDMYCAIGKDAVLNEGIRINAGGGSYEMSRGERNIDSREVDCIHGGASNKVILVTEG